MSLATTTAAENPVASVARRTRTAKATKATKATSRQGDAETKKVSFYLSPEVITRVGVAASIRGKDRSEIVEQALAEALKGLVFYDLRAKSYDQATAATEEGSAE